MRNRALHDPLRDFGLEAAALLSRAVEAGAELGFEVLEEPGSGASLYRYRALTDSFIAERWEALRRLPSFERASAALDEGAATYLSVQGVPGADAEPALAAMLERIYEDATSFDFPEERFERVYSEVERALYEDTVRMTLVIPLPGLRIEGGTLEIGEGLRLARGDAVEAPAEAVWPREGERPDARGAAREPTAICLLERGMRAGEEPPVAEARAALLRLFRTLRLLKPGGVGLGSLAWARADEGPWRAISLGLPLPGRGEPWVLGEAERAELGPLMAVVAAARPAGTVAWALRRFEMGCERRHDVEALSDYLLGLRALLGQDDATGQAGLSLRLAALCAEEPDRRAVQRRVELATALERFLIRGGGEAYSDVIGSESPADLVAEVEGHLRTLLHDVLCGYLDANVKAAADEILLASGEPFEIRARDLRAAAADRDDTGELHRVEAAEAQTEEFDAVRPPAREKVAARQRKAPEPPPEMEPPVDPVPDEGVTRSADWAPDDEDASSYSAPV